MSWNFDKMTMINFRKSTLFNRGKIHSSVLITGIFLVVIFALIVSILIYSNGNKVATSVDILPAGETATTTTPVGTGNPPSIIITTSTLSNSNPRLGEAVGHAVGIAAGSGLSKINIADLNKQLDQAVSLGATWVRFDIEWGLVQYSSPNNSSWSSYDTFINALAAHHLKGLGIILFTPEWARDSRCTGGAKCPPKDPATFATFAAEVAQRYKGRVDAWEIWNEPNNYDFWATKTDCNAYTQLLKVTYPAIKKVNADAIVITGGLAVESTDNNNVSQTAFLSCIYKDGGKNYFDAVGDHPYTFPALPSSSATNAWAQMSLAAPNLRGIMIANDDSDKKIWITEFGVPTNGPNSYWYVSEQGQVQMVNDAMNLYKTYTWAGPFFWYTLRDSGTTTDTNENFFGLTRADGSIKPAFTTLKNIISAKL
jgi:hypothetical protein